MGAFQIAVVATRAVAVISVVAGLSACIATKPNDVHFRVEGSPARYAAQVCQQRGQAARFLTEAEMPPGGLTTEQRAEFFLATIGKPVGALYDFAWGSRDDSATFDAMRMSRYWSVPDQRTPEEKVLIASRLRNPKIFVCEAKART